MTIFDIKGFNKKKALTVCITCDCKPRSTCNECTMGGLTIWICHHFMIGGGSNLWEPQQVVRMKGMQHWCSSKSPSLFFPLHSGGPQRLGCAGNHSITHFEWMVLAAVPCTTRWPGALLCSKKLQGGCNDTPTMQPLHSHNQWGIPAVGLPPVIM